MEVESAKKVLFVDDDNEFSDKARKILENENEKIDVITASSTSQALHLLEKNDFEAIVSNHQIFESGSEEFLDEVRGDKEMEIPLILFAEKRKKEIVLEALELGANRVLNKGEDGIKLSCKILSKALKQEIQNYRNKKELERYRNEFDRDYKIFKI